MLKTIRATQVALTISDQLLVLDKKSIEVYVDPARVMCVFEDGAQAGCLVIIEGGVHIRSAQNKPDTLKALGLDVDTQAAEAAAAAKQSRRLR